MTTGDQAAVPEENSPPCPPRQDEDAITAVEVYSTPADDLLQALAYVDCVLDRDDSRIGGTELETLTDEVVSEVLEETDHSASDYALYEELAKFGFAGPAWDEVMAEPLVRHGIAILSAWTRNGWIFKVLRDKDIRLDPAVSTRERRRLAGDAQLQQELVRHAVAAALTKFQRELQNYIGWNPVGGLSIKAYFVGACVFAFGNEFRKWRRREQILHISRETYLEAADLADLGHARPTPASTFADPEAAAVANSMIRDAFATLNPVERVIVLAKAWGYTAAEIAELYPEITKKAVEQRWDRLKVKHEWVNRLSDMVRKMS